MQRTMQRALQVLRVGFLLWRRRLILDTVSSAAFT
jgi:hypothetical protein